MSNPPLHHHQPHHSHQPHGSISSSLLISSAKSHENHSTVHFKNKLPPSREKIKKKKRTNQIQSNQQIEIRITSCLEKFPDLIEREVGEVDSKSKESAWDMILFRSGAWPVWDWCTWISRTSTSQRTQSCVEVLWGTSWVTEFLQGGNPPLALKKFPYRVLSFIRPPSLTGSHSTDESSRLGRVWRTLRPVMPKRKGWLEAVRYLP